jgi:integrase
MSKHNAENERIKHRYFGYLRSARGLSDASIDPVAKAIDRFERTTNFRSFKKFHTPQAEAFGRRLAAARRERDGKPLSMATAAQTLAALRAFFVWLVDQPGYRSRIRYSDADYFRLSEKDSRIAKAPQPRPVPTPEQIESVLRSMAVDTDIARRNRALIAFTWLTGVRDGAVASLKLKHVSIEQSLVNQDPREVKTKNSKAQVTTFFPVGALARQIVVEWVEFLLRDRLWSLDHPLFPATAIEQGPDRLFRAAGLAHTHWSNATAIRSIFREAFEAAGLPGFNPHSFRHALAMLGERTCKTPEEFKAWSQNLGHEQVLTTFASYGEVSAHRQAEIIKGLATPQGAQAQLQELAQKFVEIARRSERS